MFSTRSNLLVQPSALRVAVTLGAAFGRFRFLSVPWTYLSMLNAALTWSVGGAIPKISTSRKILKPPKLGKVVAGEMGTPSNTRRLVAAAIADVRKR